MMTLVDAMKLQKMLHEPAVIGIDCYDDKGNYFKKDVKRLWPPYRLFVHPNNGYGYSFSSVGKMGRASDATELCWVVCNFVGNIPILWELADKQLETTLQWHGYVLAFLSKNVFNYKFRVSNKYDRHPFSPSGEKKGNISALNEKLMNYILNSGCLNTDFMPSQVKYMFDNATIMKKVRSLYSVSRFLKSSKSCNKFGYCRGPNYCYLLQKGQFHL